MLMTACSGSMSPTSDKIQGPLGEYFEIVHKEYKANDGKIHIELKRIKEGFPSPWTKGMELEEYKPQFYIEFQDADGNVLAKDNIDMNSARDELNTLATLAENETATITFVCNGKAAKFKMGSNFDTKGTTTTVKSNTAIGENTVVRVIRNDDRFMNMDGRIGKYPIMMTIRVYDDGTVRGAYYYKKKGRGNYLYLKGIKTGNRIILNEFNKDGLFTGTYEGKLVNGVYRGRFNTMSGNYEFILKPTQMTPIDFSNVDFSMFDAEYIIYDYDI